MENRKLTERIWAGLGAVFALCVFLALSVGLSSEPAVKLHMQVITQAADRVFDCARTGDYAALGDMLYGAPKLGQFHAEKGSAEERIWEAYLSSLSNEYPGTYTLVDDTVELNVCVECLDIQGLLDEAAGMAAGKAVEDLEAPAAELVDQAMNQLLQGELPIVHRHIRLQLVRTDGGWQVVPNEDIQKLLSGFAD